MGLVERITVYLDGYFLVNLAIDGLLLSLTGALLGRPCRKGGLVLASMLGAVWACLCLFLPAFPVWAEFLLTWVGLGYAMVALAFGRKKERADRGRKDGCEKGRRKQGGWKREGWKDLVALWGVSLFAGGLLTALGERFPGVWYVTGSRAVRQWRLLPLFFWAVGMALGGRWLLGVLGRRFRGREPIYQATLYYGGRKETFPALWDTGNRLYEPYGHQPVHVVTEAAWQSSFGGLPCHPVYIPYRTVGEGRGLLAGFRIDRMEVREGGQLLCRYERPWLAVSRQPLSSRGCYQMLLHGEHS